MLLVAMNLVSLPASAATGADGNAMQAALKEIGTDLKEATDCEKDLLGYDNFKKDKSDGVTICLNNIPKDEPDAY
ncbi:hypothetical protein [Synechococcus sp. CCY 9618]|uniref:hypothetical protein n=1 Tax=Synechococcus sp. CCY 9618 TaxID=2815602 RepID=UPI001C22BD12|nr:hypothetical protein [Synechococcus sp. CCY 9618]